MTDQELNARFAEWATWVRSKRLYSPSPNPRSIIGSLRGPSGSSDAPDCALSAETARLHLAIMSMDLSRSGILIVHYLFRSGATIYRKGVLPIKTVCRELGISRATYYERVRTARRQAYERAMQHGMADTRDSGVYHMV